MSKEEEGGEAVPGDAAAGRVDDAAALKHAVEGPRRRRHRTHDGDDRSTTTHLSNGVTLDLSLELLVAQGGDPSVAKRPTPKLLDEASKGVVAADEHEAHAGVCPGGSDKEVVVNDDDRSHDRIRSGLAADSAADSDDRNAAQQQSTVPATDLEMKAKLAGETKEEAPHNDTGRGVGAAAAAVPIVSESPEVAAARRRRIAALAQLRDAEDVPQARPSESKLAEAELGAHHDSRRAVRPGSRSPPPPQHHQGSAGLSASSQRTPRRASAESSASSGAVGPTVEKVLSAQPAAANAIVFHDISGDTLSLALQFLVLSKRKGVAPETFVPDLSEARARALLHAADFLDVPSLALFAAGRLARHVNCFADLRGQQLPLHLAQLVLAHVPLILFTLSASQAAELEWDAASVWRDAYRGTIHKHRSRAAVDVESFVEYRMYGPQSSRNLTMLPPELQEWYADLDDSSDSLNFLADAHLLLRRLAVLTRHLGVARTVDAEKLARWWAGSDQMRDSATSSEQAEATVAQRSAREARADSEPPSDSAGSRGGVAEAISQRQAAPPAHGGERRLPHSATVDGRMLGRAATARPGRQGPRRIATASKIVFPHVLDSSARGGAGGVISARHEPAVAPAVSAATMARRAALARTGDEPGPPPRVGGGFAVYVSPPSKTPAKYTRRKLKLGGARGAPERAKPTKRNAAHASPKRVKRKESAEARKQRAAQQIQGIARQKRARQELSNRRLATMIGKGVLPVVPSVLELFGCGAAANDVVPRLCMVATLQLLDLRGCSQLAPASVHVIASRLPRLRLLDVSGAVECGDDEMEALGRLEHLASLQVCGWKKLTSRGLVAFAKQLPHNRVAPAIAPVPLSHRASHGMAHRLVAGLPALPCASLKELNLADCSGLTDDGVAELGRILPGLEDLSLFGCLYVSDRALGGLSTMHTRLKRLNTSGAYKVTADGTRFLLAQNPGLLLYSSPNEFGCLRAALEAQPRDAER